MESPVTPSLLAPTVTVAELADLAESIATSRYGPSPSSQLRLMRWCCTLLRTLFAAVPVAAFGPNRLRQAQREMVRKGLSRSEVNRRVCVVRRIFKLGVAHEFVPVSVLEALRALEPLRVGGTEAPEPEPVLPVPEEDWKNTLRHLSPTVRAMVAVHAVTGMRTGELVRMKIGDVDRSVTPWIYRPGRHKNSWRGAKRVIPFGPRAREALAPFLEGGLGPSDHVFSPRREMERLSAERRVARKTPLWPSHMKERTVDEPQRTPADGYSVQSYARAVTRACLRGGVPRWRPYQLRHAHLQRVRDAHGIEAVQAVGGHKSIQAAQIYAHASVERAVKLAEELG